MSEVQLACTACGHPLAEHDKIAARYCAATAPGQQGRGCVCTMSSRTDKPKPVTR